MANFHETFPNRHAVLPVVHVTDTEQVIKNAGIAQEAGADGIFLISMLGRPRDFINTIHSAVAEKFPGLWVGANYLELPAFEVFANPKPDINGIWTDNAEVNSLFEEQIQAGLIRKAQNESRWPGLYFGGVAFKYQQKVPDERLEQTARVASNYMDVITTSGDGTGNAPDVSKIQVMKSGAGDKPLAIASGISPDNVHKYLEVANAFLVATSLLKPGTQDFDPARVKDLVQAVRNH